MVFLGYPKTSLNLFTPRQNNLSHSTLTAFQLADMHTIAKDSKALLPKTIRQMLRQAQAQLQRQMLALRRPLEPLQRQARRKAQMSAYGPIRKELSIIAALSQRIQ